MRAKILIATGGTGGHLYPAEQLKEQLEGHEVHFAGHNLKKTKFFDRSSPFTEIPSSNKNPFILLKGFFLSLKLLFEFKPNVVVGFGSFHSFPILMAAIFLRKKIVLFEANCTLGRSNRFFAPFVKKIAFQFPIQHKKAAYVPLLPWNRSKNTSSEYVKDPARTTILVFGGSQGASFINQVFPKAVKLLKFPLRVIHLTGKEDPGINYECPAVVKIFEPNMKAAYEVADFVVCRAGAGTVAELISFQKPAVLIPYPHAYDHQKENGKLIEKSARMIFQNECTVERLAEEMEKLRAELEMRRQKYQELKFPRSETLGSIVLGEAR